MTWLLALLSALVLAGTVACLSSRPEGSLPTACEARREEGLPPTKPWVERSRDELRRSFDRYLRNLERIADGTRNDKTASEARRLSELERMAADELLAAWGEESGRALKAKATAAGFSRLEDYVLRDQGRELQALKDLRQRVTPAMAVECGDLRPLPRRLARGVAGPPAGTILYTDLRTGDLARIRTDGRRLDPALTGDFHSDAAFSPPGNRLAFLLADEIGGRTSLVVAAPDGSRGRRVADEVGCFAWSTDASRLAVASFYPKRVLRMVDPVVGVSSPIQGAVGCPSFLDADTLLLEEGLPDESFAAITRANLDGSARQTLYSVDGCEAVRPQVSPDGRSIAFIVGCREITRTGLYVVPVSGGSPKQVVTGLVGVFDWSPDSTWLCFVYVRPGDDSNHAIPLPRPGRRY